MKRTIKIALLAMIVVFAMTMQTAAPAFVQAESDGAVAFCDWSGEIIGARTQGWTAPNNQNISDTKSAISVSNGSLTYNTEGMTYNCQHLQVEVGMNTLAASSAIAAAKATDQRLRVTFKLDKAESSSGATTVKFKMYCFADGDWQNGPTLIDGGAEMSAGETRTFYIDVNDVTVIPDTIAINAMNYNTGLTAINYTVSSVLAGGNDATYTTSKEDSNLPTVAYEDYGDLINHRLLGDVIKDDAVNTADLLALKKLVSGYELNDDADSEAADVWEDGKINAKDVYAAIQTVNGERTAVHRPVTTDGEVNYNPHYDMTDNGNYIINGKEYSLAFYDDFEGVTLNRKKWERCPEQERHNGNVWRNEMVSMNGKGGLVLSNAVDEDYSARCKSGAVRTKDRFYNSYGYYEARVLLQQYSRGFWGAFWIMPDAIDTGIDGGSDGTEIDIFESAYLYTDKVQQGIHFDGYGSRHKTVGQATRVKDVYYGYHTFGLSWEPDKYVFYVDGKRTYTLKEGDVINGTTVNISKVASYVKLSVEAGTWAGSFDPENSPHNIDGITVDYVKVYKPAE